MKRKPWAAAMSEMAQEQTWGNFKKEAAKFAKGRDSNYMDALHEVWDVMYDFQLKEVAGAAQKNDVRRRLA